MFYFGILLSVCILSVTLTRGMENSGCPESKKLYPGDCRLFYKCVPLSDSAQAYVWVPSRCTAGLVFHPSVKKCIRPENGWSCQQDREVPDMPFYNDLPEDEDTGDNDKDDLYESETTQKNFIDDETTTENYSNGETMYDPASSVLNAMEQDRVPLSIVNNTSMDQIGNQMYRLTQLINSLKASPTSSVAPIPEGSYNIRVKPTAYSASPQKPSYHSNPSRNTLLPFKSHVDSTEYEMNLLPTQMQKITAQLIRREPNKLSSNVDLLPKYSLNESEQNMTGTSLTSNSQTYLNTEHLVSALFKRYLINGSFMSGGEYVKKSPTLIPVKTVKISKLNNSIAELSVFNISSSKHVKNSNKLEENKACLAGLRTPNTNDCTRYFFCNPSTTKMQSYTCPPNTAFNKFKRICDVEEYRRCAANLIEGYPENKIIRHNEIPCDTQMCGGLQHLHKSVKNKPR